MVSAVVVGILGWGLVSAAEPLKIGYIDAQQVLDRSELGQASKGKLEKYVLTRQQVIDLDEEELRHLDEELKKQGAVLSPEAQRDKQETLQRKLLSYQKRATELNKEVQDRREEVLREFNVVLAQAAKRVAERDGYTFVFDKERDGGVVLYAQEGLDITDDVITELDRMAADTSSEKAPSQ